MRKSVAMLLAVMAAVLLTLSACESESLAGTTWKGANAVGDEVTIVFIDQTDCQFGALGSATYTVSGNQVTVTAGEYEYVFFRDGDEMKGAGLRIFKQR